MNKSCSKYNKGCVFIEILNIGNDKVSHRMDKHPPVFPSPPNSSEAPVNPNKNHLVFSTKSSPPCRLNFPFSPRFSKAKIPFPPVCFVVCQLLGGSSQDGRTWLIVHDDRCCPLRQLVTLPKMGPIHHMSPGITLQVKNSQEFKVPPPPNAALLRETNG